MSLYRWSWTKKNGFGCSPGLSNHSLCPRAYHTERSRFDETLSDAADLDPRTLAAARLSIRPEKENAAFDEIRNAFPEKLPVFLRHDTTVEVDHDLNNLSLERALQGMQQSIQNDRKQVPQRQNRGKAEKYQESR